jgi:Dyp-type peroxidase family
MSHQRRDTQGNIVRGYRHLRHAAYLFCRMDDVKPARELLTELADTQVTTDEHWPRKEHVRSTLNIAFTYAGLEQLGWAPAFDEFQDFREGMRRRAGEHLRDTGENDPAGWEPELRDGAHVLFTIYGSEPAVRQAALDELSARLARAGIAPFRCQFADTVTLSSGRHAREFFGFRDGFSQPALRDGIHPHRRPSRSPIGEGTLVRRTALIGRSEWRPIRLGEFLLGHVDEDGVKAGGEDSHGVLRNGTFMVWRKLEQRADWMKRFFERAAGGDPERQSWLEAKVVGRWKDGTSLLNAPYAQPPHREPEGRPSNDFDYGSDPTGARCPLGAHVRRANPRTSLKWGTERTRRHRIIRRGIPYEDGEENGLIFVCFNASISRQFELIQGKWMMDGDAFGLGGEQDALLGHGDPEGKITIDGDRGRPATFLRRPDEPFVRTRGGYYLYVPGMAGLRLIARREARLPGRHLLCR